MPLDTQQLLQLGIPFAVALLGLLVGFVVRRTLLARLARAAKDTRSTVDDVIVSAVHGPVVVWFFVAGLYAAVHVTRLSPRVVGLIQIVLVVLVILSVSWTLASIAGAALQAMAERADIPSATLVNNLARITVLGQAAAAQHHHRSELRDRIHEHDQLQPASQRAICVCAGRSGLRQ